MALPMVLELLGHRLEDLAGQRLVRHAAGQGHGSDQSTERQDGARSRRSSVFAAERLSQHCDVGADPVRRQGTRLLAASGDIPGQRSEDAARTRIVAVLFGQVVGNQLIIRKRWLPCGSGFGPTAPRADG